MLGCCSNETAYIILKTFVNSLDHLRLLNSIKKNIQNNKDNIPKDFWNEPKKNLFLFLSLKLEKIIVIKKIQ